MCARRHRNGQLFFAGSSFRIALALSRLFDVEIVVHGEHAGHAVGADEGSVFIRLGTHHAFQVHMAVLHNDVNWPHGLNAVGGESRITENGAAEDDRRRVALEDLTINLFTRCIDINLALIREARRARTQP